MPSASVIITLILSVASAMSEVVLLVGLGILLRNVGLMDRDMTRKISALLFHIIAPAFEFWKCAKSFSLDMLRQVWVAPLLACLYIFIAHVTSNILLCREKGLNRKIPVMASTFTNFSSIPFVFTSALIKSGVFVGDVQELEDRALGYVAMFLAPNIVIMFSYGYLYLTLTTEEIRNGIGYVKLLLCRTGRDSDTSTMTNLQHDNEEAAAQGDDTTLREDDVKLSVKEEEIAVDTPTSPDFPVINGSAEDMEDMTSDSLQNGNDFEHADVGDDFPIHTTDDLDESIVFEEHSQVFEIENQARKRSLRDNPHLQTLWSVISFSYNRVLTPPLIAIFLSLALSVNPWVKEHVITNPPLFISSVIHVIEMVGDGFFPLSMFMLGANLSSAMFSKPPSEKKHSEEEVSESLISDSPTTSDPSIPPRRQGTFWERNCPSPIWFVHKNIIRRYFIKFNSYSTLFKVILCKLFIVPLMALVIVNLGVAFNIIDSDPVLLVVLLVEASTPCALTMVLLCNLAGDKGVEMMSELTLWSYVVSPFSLVFWTSIYLANSCAYSPMKCTS